MSTALSKLTEKFASRFELNPDEVLTTLKQTAFKGDVSNAQMAALLVVADQYGLNPFCRELYAFPDKQNGIVPVVSVDGWSRIINEQPMFDGLEFSQDNESCTCVIFRKDRSHPTKVTEWLDECYKNPITGRNKTTGESYTVNTPWQTHPKRMLRHKALIQCARLAFGFGGIYDQDEAERIVEKDIGSGDIKQETKKLEQLPSYPVENWVKSIEKWKKQAESGLTEDAVLSFLTPKYMLTDQQINEIKQIFVIEGGLS